MWALAGANKGRGGEAQKKGRAIKPPSPLSQERMPIKARYLSHCNINCASAKNGGVTDD
jgi:hypothetical protein